MCPDIEVYAPLVAAAFGLADVVDDGHPAHRLRVRLADRALRADQPAARDRGQAAGTGRRPGHRVAAARPRGLAAGAPPLRLHRRRPRADRPVDRRLRRPLGPGRRGTAQPFGLGGFPQGTWRAGLDRILLGATMAEEGGNWLGLALPIDDVGSGDVDLAGRLAELADRVQLAVDLLAGPKPVADWLATLSAAVAGLTSVSGDDAWQQGELDREFADIAAGAGPGSTTVLRLPDVRALLAGRLGGRPTRANFRTGNLTVCTMVPMRSVPHRVICLVGLDDGVFPRGAHPDGDDVLARDPVVGERDRRGEDRQLLLDALLAATGTVVITYTGADERTGAIRPPSVPVGELLDTLDDMAVTAAGAPARSQVLVRHPAAALRRPQRHPRRAGRPRAVQLRPGRAGGGHGRRPVRGWPPRRSSTQPLPDPAADGSRPGPADRPAAQPRPRIPPAAAGRGGALRGERAVRRAARRAGRPAAVGHRRAAAARPAGRPGPRHHRAGRVAARDPAARSARPARPRHA